MAKKNILCFALAVLMLFSLIPAGALTAYAESSDGFIYQTEAEHFHGASDCYRGDGSDLIITGYDGPGGAVTIPPTIKGKKVIAIGWGAFSQKTNVTSISFPPTLKVIDTCAFAGCGLESVTLPNVGYGQGIFSGCPNLETVTITPGVTFIGASSFAHCPKLKNVTIPSSVTLMESRAFDECDSLKTVHYLGTSESWEKLAAPYWAGKNNVSVHFITQYSSITKATLSEDGSVNYTCAESGCGDWSFQTAVSRPKTFTLSNNTYTFDRKCKEPGVTVKDADGNIIDASHYTVTYADHIHAGTASAIVNFSRSKLYSGKKTLNFTIKPKKITPYVKLHDKTLTYNGKAQKTIVYVKDGDYTISIDNCNFIWPSDLTNVGTKTVKVTLKGDYSGTKSVSYKIVPKAIKPTVTLSKTAFTFNGKAQKPAVTVKDDFTKIPASNYTVKWPNVTDAGKKTVTVTMKGNYSGTASASYKINVKAITPDVKLSSSAFTYNGSAKTPDVTVKNGSVKLKKGKDYTVTYASGRKNVGTYKVTVKTQGNYSGSKTVSFKINPKGTTLSSITPGKKKLSFKVKKQATQTSGYQIQCSTKSGFTGDNYLFTLNGTNTLSKTTSGTLKANKTYYVRVRTFKTVGKAKYYSAWSAVKTVKTK